MGTHRIAMDAATTHRWVPDATVTYPTDSLAARLVLTRRQLGLSQRAAADRCGLTFGEWQSLEDGRQARGLDHKVARISDGLGVDRDWILWGSPAQLAS